MFRESLLESTSCNRKRWPMAVAVSLETTICAALIALPLFSSGVISIAARRADPIPIASPREVHRPPQPPAGNQRGGRGNPSVPKAITVVLGSHVICYTCEPATTIDGPDDPNIDFSNSNNFPLDLPRCVGDCGSKPVHGPVAISNLSPGSLIYRVEPVYPRLAALTRVSGIVRLHAIIATNGTIQSLQVIDGPPLLIPAAQDAVRQWRYRPYILNGHAVEVETVITVNFRGAA